MSYDGEYDASEYPDGINAPRFGWRGSREMAELRAAKDAEIERLRAQLAGSTTTDGAVVGANRSPQVLVPGQAECAEWTDRNFPGDTLEHRALVLVEEVGEVVRCVLKMQQGIRGTRDEWMAELRKEVGDVQATLYALCHRAGFDLNEAWAERWLTIATRDYRSDPKQQGLPDEAAP